MGTWGRSEVPGDILSSWRYFGGSWGCFVLFLRLFSPSPCASDQLRCGDGSCLSRSFACDGDRDCPDGEDELGCPSPPPSWPCDPSFFTCRDGSCIAWLWRCDGDPDCRDGNDEENCGTPPPPRPCPSLQFPCGSGECVHRRWRCDGTPDCRDGSDEEGCGACTAPPCPSGQLRCRDGRCIPGARACDGTPDCRDGDDEEECPDAPSCSPPHRFRCRSGECIATAQVCDGQRHCRDWSDEPLKECGVNECLAGNGGCSHGCRDLRVGFECLCPPGFSLNPDNRTCHSGVLGGWGAPCQVVTAMLPPGPPGTLLVSTRHEVLALGGPEPQTLQRSLKHVAALDIGVEEGSLFWGDPSEGLIYRAPLAPGPAVPLGVVPGPGSPAGIALDWIHRLLYWTEPGSGRVAVSDRSGTRHRTLHRDPDARPWGVVVDPLNGYLYWSDWGSRPHIAQGAQDGAPPKLLVTEDMERPQGLALDQSSQRLYWTDGRLHTVSSVALDGSGRRTHLRDPQHLAQPFGLAVFQDWAFWTDPHQGSLVAARLQGGSPTPQVVAQELFSPEAVVVLHPGRQPAGKTPKTPLGPPVAPNSPGDPPSSVRCPQAPTSVRVPEVSAPSCASPPLPAAPAPPGSDAPAQTGSTWTLTDTPVSQVSPETPLNPPDPSGHRCPTGHREVTPSSPETPRNSPKPLPGFTFAQVTLPTSPQSPPGPLSSSPGTSAGREMPREVTALLPTTPTGHTHRPHPLDTR
uniref:EGF-like domain-containing protein n=1 Tax=Catharus ustulatus TaxID=91951 RepID=A0A8C3UCL0_CATUS